MSLTSLKDEVRGGVESLDYEHRGLIAAMQELCERFESAESSPEISDLFGALLAKASAHFALEERLMREKKYALYETHKADHERLLEQLRFMMEAYEEGMCADCGTTLRACLEAWIAGHVRDADAGLRSLAD